MEEITPIVATEDSVFSNIRNGRTIDSLEDLDKRFIQFQDIFWETTAISAKDFFNFLNNYFLSDLNNEGGMVAVNSDIVIKEVKVIDRVTPEYMMDLRNNLKNLADDDLEDGEDYTEDLKISERRLYIFERALISYSALKLKNRIAYIIEKQKRLVNDPDFVAKQARKIYNMLEPFQIQEEVIKVESTNQIETNYDEFTVDPDTGIRILGDRIRMVNTPVEPLPIFVEVDDDTMEETVLTVRPDTPVEVVDIEMQVQLEHQNAITQGMTNNDVPLNEQHNTTLNRFEVTEVTAVAGDIDIVTT